MSNEELAALVAEELRWDPKVGSESIAVAADDGAVILRGSVGTLREKREARKAAQRVHGVRSVDNELQVELMIGGVRDDADLRADVLRALMLNTLVPATVDARVYAGFVTLTGTAEWQFQRDEAESVAVNVPGVLDVTNEIGLTGRTASAEEVQHSIKSAFERHARLDAEGLSVTMSNGVVTVKGKVSSLAERDDAIDAAWAAPGVRRVHDRTRLL